uniref:Ferritin n=1 Tax=Myotis lucifugus TaxID=59463 RepID=G1Q6Z6_MYOLU
SLPCSRFFKRKSVSIMLLIATRLKYEAGAAREAWVPGARGKPVPAAGGRKAYPCTNFVHWTSSQASPTQVRQNYHQDQEASSNHQINLELYAPYIYLPMSYYFGREDVALKNFVKYFLYQSHEKGERAQKLMKLQIQRVGGIFLQDIMQTENGLNAMECALHLEKILELHKLATVKNDPYLYDFNEFNEEVKTKLCKMPSPPPQFGTAEYLFDKHTLGDSDESHG